MEMYIVLAVAAFMMVMFLINKFPFGVITMTCCVVLALAGILTPSQAFNGFTNNTVILIAPMLALSHSLTKTAIVPMIRRKMEDMQGKKGLTLLLFFFAVTIAFVQFIPATATFSILIVFLMTLPQTGDITVNRLLLPMLGISCIWKSRIPIGMGATSFVRFNALYEGMATSPDQMLQMMDIVIVAIIPTIALTVYCLFAWRMLPSQGEVSTAALKDVKQADELPKNKQIIVYAVFVVVMAVLVLNNWTGNLMYVAPAAGVLVLIYTKCLSVPEAVKAMTGDMVWMIAGVLVVASALGSSGAGDLVGNALLGVFGEHPNSLVVMLVFAAVSIIMTVFLSNNATMNVLTPVAAAVAIAGGWDPRGIICIIAIGNTLAIAFPSGAAECALVFAAGNYNPGKVLKFTLPYILIAIVTLAVSANLIFPLYG